MGRRGWTTVVLYASLFWTFSDAQGQILPLKPTAEKDAAEEPVDAKKESPGTSDDLPVWERQFFRNIKLIDAAIAAAEEEAAHAVEHSENPLLRTHLLDAARSQFVDAVQGLDLAVHFRLLDIDAGKEYSRLKQAFELTLGEPTFPSHAYSSRVTVVISPKQARRLRIGSIVRLEGKMLEKGHRAFDVVHFVRKIGTAPRFGDAQVWRRSALPRFKDKDIYVDVEFGKSYSLALYVDNVRVISGRLLEDYQAFMSRYESYLDGNADSTAESKPASSQEPGGGGPIDLPEQALPLFSD